MEILNSCIIHEGIARKLGKWPYIENKKAACQENEPGYFYVLQPIAETR